MTGEIPVVRIRNEAAAGHTTRQVLLTGPIPVIDEKTTAETAPATAEAQSTAQTATSEATKSTSPATTDADVESATSADTSANAVAADLADTVPQATSRTEDQSAAGAPRVSDPFQRRPRTRDGWSPTPPPVPSYVDAAEADHAVPTPKAADASSYETEARDRENIAAQFAEELGYRAELSDSARDDSPLEHGRKGHPRRSGPGARRRQRRPRPPPRLSFSVREDVPADAPPSLLIVEDELPCAGGKPLRRHSRSMRPASGSSGRAAVAALIA